MIFDKETRHVWMAAALVVAGIAFPATAGAQGAAPFNNPLTGLNMNDQYRSVQEKELSQMSTDPREESAFQSFHSASEPAKKIQMGQDFMKKYPKSIHMESVYEELVQAYYAKNDLKDFYDFTDQGIKAFPDDVPLLTLDGWVIPRAFSHDDPDGNNKLDKAATYEKHAIEVLTAMKKPMGMNEDQFNQYKTGELAVAHSGLGLTYFRQSQFEDSAKELQAATQAEKVPDQTDFYVLGADFENLAQHKEAADAFGHCAQIAGNLKDNCKKFADEATKEAAQAK